MFNIIFPAKPGTNFTIDSFWEKEYYAAKSANFNISLLSGTHFGSVLEVRGNNQIEKSLYRGWIVKPETYKEMDSCLNLNLLNSYDDYIWSYEFPKWYKDLEGETPNSFTYIADDIVNLGLESLAKIISLRVGSKSIIIKDWLKSRKHEWYDACFIRDASDKKEVFRVMSNFFKLQGRDFYGGLVFREFLSLKMIGLHPKSSMPLPIEFRAFFLNGNPIFTTPYWSNDISYPKDMEAPPIDWLKCIGGKLKMPFVALDIAQDTNGKWWVIEVNSGNCAGLPDHVNMDEFYKILFNRLNDM